MSSLAELIFTEIEKDDLPSLIKSGVIPQEDIIKMYEATQCPSWGRLARYLVAKSDRAGRREAERKEDAYANGVLEVAGTIIALRNEIINMNDKAAGQNLTKK